MMKRIFLTFLVMVTMLTELMTPLGRAATLFPVYLELPDQNEPAYPPETIETPKATEPIDETTSSSGIILAPPYSTTSPQDIISPPGVSIDPPGSTSSPGITTPPGITSPPGISSATTPSAITESTTPQAIQQPLALQLPEHTPTKPEALSFQRDVEAMVDKAVKKSGIRGTFGLFIMDLKNEYTYGKNENLTQWDPKDQVPEGYFNSASVIKLFQGYLLCDMLRRGELDSEKTYHDRVTGRKFKLLPMIKSMISYSDNNYSNACLRLVDNKKSNEVLTRLGIVNSRLYGEMSGAVGYSRENNIAKYGTDKRCARLTPYDTGLILYNIYKNKDSDGYMKALNEALLKNVYNTRIPVGVHRVSSKYAVAHKTGTNSALGVYNDAGIVYTPNPYILVAFTQGTTNNTAHTFIRSLAEQLTHYFKK